MQTNNIYLKIINFNELSLWDVKRLFLSSVKSSYKIVSLKEVIKERSKKVNLYDFQDETFWILWVNNKEWIFDAYEEIWKNINQAYKKVYLWDLAYNPYRVNVWSVWIKTEKHKFDYISPAYVVLSCDKTQLLPEYFYILFKSDLFNWLVNENTTWSVRQNLKFSTLADIKIPLPRLEKQNEIVELYNNKLHDSLNAENKTLELEKEIESYLMDELGIEIREKEEKKVWLNFVDFKDLSRWDLKENLNWFKSKYEIVNIWKIAEVKGWKRIPKWKSYSLENTNFQYLRVEDFNKQDNILEWKLKFIDKKVFELLYKYKIDKWDLLISIAWTLWSTLFINNNLKYPTILTENSAKLITSSKINTRFLQNIINSSTVKSQIKSINTTSTIPKLWLDKVKSIKIPLPPLEIQEKIVKHIWELKDEIKRLKSLSEELKESAKIEFEREIFM